MPKLIFKIQPRTFLIAVFACLLILLGGRILLATGIIIPFVLLVSIVGGVYVYRKKKFEKRVDLLRNKYRDDNLVQRIMKRNYWIG